MPCFFCCPAASLLASIHGAARTLPWHPSLPRKPLHAPPSLAMTTLCFPIYYMEDIPTDSPTHSEPSVFPLFPRIAFPVFHCIAALHWQWQQLGAATDESSIWVICNRSPDDTVPTDARPSIPSRHCTLHYTHHSL